MGACVRRYSACMRHWCIACAGWQSDIGATFVYSGTERFPQGPSLTPRVAEVSALPIFRHLSHSVPCQSFGAKTAMRLQLVGAEATKQINAVLQKGSCNKWLNRACLERQAGPFAAIKFCLLVVCMDYIFPLSTKTSATILRP
eukprot:1142563-Pelagomonas_calceolata.AAC.2